MCARAKEAAGWTLLRVLLAELLCLSPMVEQWDEQSFGHVPMRFLLPSGHGP